MTQEHQPPNQRLSMRVLGIVMDCENCAELADFITACWAGNITTTDGTVLVLQEV